MKWANLKTSLDARGRNGKPRNVFGRTANPSTSEAALNTETEEGHQWVSFLSLCHWYPFSVSAFLTSSGPIISITISRVRTGAQQYRLTTHPRFTICKRSIRNSLVFLGCPSMGLADLLPVPPFDGAESSPPRRPSATSALDERREVPEKDVKVSKRKRAPESITIEAATGGQIRREKSDQGLKVLDKKAKKRRKATRGAADSVTLVADPNEFKKQQSGDAHPSKSNEYEALYAQLETRVKAVKGNGKRRGHEDVIKTSKVLDKSAKAEDDEDNLKVAASNGSSQRLLSYESRNSGENEALSAEADRRARKNAKRKQRREKALSFKGTAQKCEAAEKVTVGKDGNIDSTLVRKKSKKRESSSLARGEKGETAANSEDHGQIASSQGSLHVEQTGLAKKTKPASFLEKMQARLWGGKFRMLNETLYTCNGEDAFALFEKDPSAFETYHAGYQEQMARWPKLPVVVIADWLRSHTAELIVADFGCGDGRLAEMVGNKVFSLDLVASKPSIIACNMAHTPLDSSSVDVAVFCLSLMGTDYPSYLKEAHRVLKPSGWLLIAEVRSRFDPNNGGADPGEFSQALKSLGFSPELEDSSNKMFILLYFKKQAGKLPKNRKTSWPELKPCVYKRR